MSYTHLTADDPSIEVYRGVFAKVRRALGTTAFGINEIRMPPNFEGPEHDESETGHEEVYIAIAGSGTAVVDGEAVQLARGDYLRVDAAATRVITAGSDGLTFIVVAAKPLAAYDGRPSL